MVEKIEQRDNQEADPIPESLTDEELVEKIKETSRDSERVHDDMHRFIHFDYPETDEGRRFVGVAEMPIEEQIKQFPKLFEAMDGFHRRDREAWPRYLRYQQEYGRRKGRDYFQEKFGDKLDRLFREVHGLPFKEEGKSAQLTEQEKEAKTREMNELNGQYKEASGTEYDFIDVREELQESKGGLGIKIDFEEKT